MYKKIFIFTLIFLAFTLLAYSQGKVYFYDFDIGFKLLQIEQKTALVVVDSEHCVYCKKLKTVTFADDNVANILNAHYITIELSLDDKKTFHYKQYELTPQTFAAGFKIRGTPTLIFFNEKQEAMTLLPGYLPPDKIIPVLKYIGQRIFEKNIKFGDYMKKPVVGKYRGSDKVISISLEDLLFVAKNDPFVKVYDFLNGENKKEFEDIKDLVKTTISTFKDKFLSKLPLDKKYILIGDKKEDLEALGTEMLSKGFSTVLIYNVSNNKTE